MRTRHILSLFAALFAFMTLHASTPPNVVIVLTDDQGFGDVSLYGNPVIETPHMDNLAREGVSFDQFHVTSMCSPTRGALLTGLNPLRNGVISTCQGLHALRRGHPTVAEVFRDAGYATGLFGKWHLGRNWPNRPQDRGFEEALVLHGFGQTGISSRWNNDYIDTWVVHNGVERQTEGFCTDAFFNEAMAWIEEQASAEKPFFALIPTNAPHFPFWAPHDLTAKYAHTKNPEFFAMLDNLDTNMGRLDEFLREQDLAENTIVVFLSDNGPVGGKSTYNAGMTGGKATPWEGGHRVPLFIRFPEGKVTGGRVVEGLTDVVDLFPTLMDLCGLQASRELDLDGISLKPAMLGEAEVPERFLVMHIQQDELTPKNAAVMEGPWRLLWSDSLYNVAEDLAQQNDLAQERSEVFVDMWKRYQRYFYTHQDYATTHPPEIIGSEYQDEVILDASYWMGPRADGQESVRSGASERFSAEGGAWKVEAAQPGTYEVILRRWPIESGLALTDGAEPFQTQCSGKPLSEGVALPIEHATLEVDRVLHTARADSDPSAIRFEIELDAGEHTLHGIFRDENGRALCGAFYAYVTRIP